MNRYQLGAFLMVLLPAAALLTLAAWLTGEATFYTIAKGMMLGWAGFAFGVGLAAVYNWIKARLSGSKEEV